MDWVTLAKKYEYSSQRFFLAKLLGCCLCLEFLENAVENLVSFMELLHSLGKSVQIGKLCIQYIMYT